MSGLDLTEAVEAGSDILRAQGFFPSPAVRELVTRGIMTAALPHIERQVREQVHLDALRVLRVHTIECTAPGEVTCRDCRDKGWMSWSAYREHVAALIAGGDS